MISLVVVLISLITIRCFFMTKRSGMIKVPIDVGMAQYIGDKEVQADSHEMIETQAGILLVLSDGIGKGSRGRVASRVATKAFTTLYTPYHQINNINYFFRRAFNLANAEILKVLEDRPGGASIVAATLCRGTLHYALAGDIKLAVFRRGQLIPLSEGHTVNILANKSYKEGKLTKQKALWALKENRLWNYVGRDGFKEIEYYDVPVKVQTGDTIMLMTKGVYNTLGWIEIEKCLKNISHSAQEQAYGMIDLIMKKEQEEKDNSSVMILKVKNDSGVSL